MGVNERLIEALSPICPEVVPDEYTGDESEYMTFSYSELPTFTGDNLPEFIRYLITVDWFFPAGVDPRSRKRRIRRALEEAGFDSPEIYNDSTADRQHYTIETEWLSGTVEG